MRKSRFFPSFFFGTDLLFPANQGKEALKKPKGGQKKERREEKKKKSSFHLSHTKRKKKRKFSLYSFSLFSLSLSLLVPHKDIHIHN